MGDTTTNLKVRFGAETKNFRKDMESGKAAVDNFSNEAKSSLSSFAAVFGINLDAVSEKMKAFQKAFTFLWEGFKGAFKATEDVSNLGKAKLTATTASEGLTAATAAEATATTAAATAQTAAASATLKHSAAWKVLKLAIASTGIGLLIVALGSLVSYFTKTERGAEGVEKVMASFKAIFNVLIDRLSVFGEGLFLIFTGKFGAGWEALKKSVSGLGSEIAKESKQAWDNTKALQALEDKEIALIEIQGKRSQSIEELRLKAKDLELSEKERLAALSEAISIQKQMTADEFALQKERVQIQKKQYEMGNKMDDETRALAESRAKLNQIDAAGLATIRGMTREYNTLTKSIEENNNKVDEAIIKKIEQEKADSKGLTALKPVDNSIKTEWKLITDEKGNEKWSKVLSEGLETDKLEASANKVKSILGDLKTTSIDIGGAIEAAMNNLAVSFGENLGLLLAGADGAKGIGEILGSAFGDLLLTIGKATIGAGTAFLAMSLMFKAGIATPGAAIAAIAAGIALVAIGTAFKTSVASAASGGGGTFSSAGSGNNSSIGVSSAGVNSYRLAPMTINITGTFRQQGRDLVAVIEKESTIKKIST
ncbi:MAG: hypothetical protein C0397_02485 [Odoribacter sp.]|nr:hypothetical protein [Odoribacter sp.]